MGLTKLTNPEFDVVFVTDHTNVDAPGELILFVVDHTKLYDDDDEVEVDVDEEKGKLPFSNPL